MDSSERIEKIPVGISSCLLGEKVRFDGGHKNSPYIAQTLSEYFQFRSFCPELFIGLGVPRETIRLVQDENDSEKIRCVGTKNPELDVTEKLSSAIEPQKHWLSSLRGYIFKKGSPSCGMERVKVYLPNGMPHTSGSGLFAKQVMDHYPHLPVEEEGRLGDAKLRENFIKRVLIYDRWRKLIASVDPKKPTAAITEFHARHKLIYMSHNQNLSRDLGKLTAQMNEFPFDHFCDQYISKATEILKKPATTKNHVNVLQHIQGYLKRDLDSEDKQELTEVIEQYRKERLPLIVPITLFRHHFRKAPNDYILDSYYMNPHPTELMLLNRL